LLAGRYPAFNQFNYLPWQAKYRLDTRNAGHFDMCRDLQTSPPPVIVYDGNPIWNYQVKDFAPCLLTTLSEQYAQDEIYHEIYIRKDRLSFVNRAFSAIQTIGPSDQISLTIQKSSLVIGRVDSVVRSTNGEYRFSGWAVDMATGSPVDIISAFVERRLVTSVRPSIQRQDVVKALSEERATLSGFSFTTTENDPCAVKVKAISLQSGASELQLPECKN
jgi:hypothetical protein